MPKIQHNCQRCGNEWFSWMPEPKACPKCKQYGWRQPAGAVGRPRTAAKKTVDLAAEQNKIYKELGKKKGETSC